MMPFTYSSLVDERKKNDKMYSYIEIQNNTNNKNTLDTKEKIDAVIKNIKQNNYTIENVYQQEYSEGTASGLGDFIRGSYFLIHFCKKNNISYNINLLNHPICQLLDIYKNKEQQKNINNINKFENFNYNAVILKNNIISNINNDTIYKDFVFYLSKQKKKNSIIYVYIISYPIINIDNDDKEIMKQIFKPTNEISFLVDKKLSNLRLTKNRYTVIHIRFGDDYLVNKKENIHLIKVNKILYELDKIDKSSDYLLISDNMLIKKYIINKYPFVKTHFNEITHTADTYNMDAYKLQNTMVDFCLISYSIKVIAFSVYKHGTGFSKWCAETYDIPYSCQFIE